MNVHLVNMKMEGEIDLLWEEYRKASIETTCENDSKEASIDDRDQYRLSVFNVGGIFAFHAILVLVSIC